MKSGNMLAGVPQYLNDEQIEALAGQGSMRVERIVSTGQSSPDGFWYDQETDEFVLILAGAAELEFEKKSRVLNVGDWLVIPAHCRHRVRWTAPEEATVWLAVHGRGL